MIKDKTHGKVPYITLVIVPPNVLVMGADVFFSWQFYPTGTLAPFV